MDPGLLRSKRPKSDVPGDKRETHHTSEVAEGEQGVLTVVIGTFIEARLEMFIMAMQMCLDKGEFPERQK